MEVVGFFAIAAAVAVVAGALVFGRRDVQRRREVWRALAERRGWRFVPAGRSWLRNEPAAIEARSEHAIVWLDTYIVSSGKSSTTYTRAKARFAIGGGPRFQVYEEGVMSSLGKALGTQDVTLGGDAAFDDWFMVKCEDAEATRRVWTESATRRMRVALPNSRATSDGREVQVIANGFIDDVRTLEAVISQAAELASFGGPALAQLADELPRAELVSAEGEWQSPRPPRVLVDTSAGSVELTSVPVAGGLGLVLALTARPDLPPFTLTVTDGRTDEEPPRGLFDAESAAQLGTLEGAVLRHEGGRLCLRFDRWPEDRDEVEQAIALLVRLAAAPSAGAFR